MEISRKIILLLVLMTALAIAYLVRSTAGAKSANISGTWNLTVDADVGKGNPMLTLKQDGEALTGLYTGLLGKAPLTGTIKGNKIRFVFKITTLNRDLDIEYIGTVEGNKMKGRVMLGVLGEGTFTGEKI